VVGFQTGLHVFTIATGTPEAYPIPNDLMATQWAIRPGELVAHMPRVGVLRPDGTFRT